MQESTEPAAAIQAIQQHLAEAVANGDFAVIAGLFTENAWLLPPQLGAIGGRDSIRQFWQEATNLQSLSFRTEHLEPIGTDALREIGTMRLGLAGQGGGAGGEVPSKYVFVWRRDDGEWRIETAIWNRVAPAQPMGGRRRGGIGMGGGNRGPQRGRRPQRGTFVPLLD